MSSSRRDVVRVRRRWRTVWVVSGVALVLLALGILFASPVYRQLKLRRARAIVVQSESLIAADRWLELQRPVQLALRYAPEDSEVLRFAARYASHFGSIDGVGYWTKLIERRQADRSDQLVYVRLCQDIGRLDLSGQVVHRLMAEYPDDREVQLAGLYQVRLLGDFVAAAGFSQRLLEKFPDDGRARWHAGDALLSDPNLERRVGGRKILWDVATRGGDYQLLAIRRLTESRELNVSETEALVKILTANSDAKLPDRLLALELQRRLEPKRSNEIIALARGLMPTVPTLDDQDSYATWLIRQEEWQAVLDRWPLASVKREPRLLQHRLHALGQLARWEELSETLSDETLPIDEVSWACFRGLAEARLKKPAMVAANFQKALAAARRRPQTLVTVGRYAELAEVNEVALEAYEPLLSIPQTAVPTAREMLRLARPIADMKWTLRPLRKLAEYLPNDPTIQNELAYTEWALPVALSDLHAIAVRSINAATNEHSHRVTLALGAFRENRLSEALAWLERSTVVWDDAPARAKAVYAAVLGANQLRDAARRVAKKVDLTQLKDQERLLIRPWLE